MKMVRVLAVVLWLKYYSYLVCKSDASMKTDAVRRSIAQYFLSPCLSDVRTAYRHKQTHLQDNHAYGLSLEIRICVVYSPIWNRMGVVILRGLKNS